MIEKMIVFCNGLSGSVLQMGFNDWIVYGLRKNNRWRDII